MKYCQVCGNASYDSAPVCGNCGAKLPPKSKENSTPPSKEKLSQSDSSASEISIFSNKTSGLGSRLSQTLSNLSSPEIGKSDIDKEREAAFLESSPKPSFTKATEGFRQKDKAIKNPAKKYDVPKTESVPVKEETVRERIIPKKEAPKKEIKKELPKKEIKREVPKKETEKVKEEKAKPVSTATAAESSTGINFRKIGIIAIIAIIILIIAGIGINGIQNQTTDEVMNYTDGTIFFNYSGNWSVYNNTEEGSNFTDIAFKTKDNTLIGFTTIQSDDITYEKILSDVNDTAHSLNGELIEYKDISINGVPSLEMTISTADQGYSRYICILRDGVYYCFVANNAKSNNHDLTALNTTEIQNMIGSINFTNSINEESTYQDTSYEDTSYQDTSYQDTSYEEPYYEEDSY